MLQPSLSRSAGVFRAPTSQLSRLLQLGSRQNGRFYSIKPEVASDSKPQDIDPRKLKITKTTTPGVLQKPEDLIFGRTFTGEPSSTLA